MRGIRPAVVGSGEGRAAMAAVAQECEQVSEASVKDILGYVALNRGFLMLGKWMDLLSQNYISVFNHHPRKQGRIAP